MGRPLVALVHVFVVVASRRLSAWTSPAAVTVVDTNAPVLRWSSQVDSNGTFAYSVVVTRTHDGANLWASGEVWQGNWPSSSPAFPGLCVYEGPQLKPGEEYSFTVRELQRADGSGANVSRSWDAGGGRFTAASDLPSATEELVQELQSPNMTRLWETSRRSIWVRVEPSGFFPTSVSGNYGGITSEFVRDAAGMLIGMLELGPERWETAREALRFMLHGLQCCQNAALLPGCDVAFNKRRPPEVLKGDCDEDRRKQGECNYSTKIVGADYNEETDGAFYVIAAWGRIVNITGDMSLEKDFYATLKVYMEYYFTPGAVSSTGTPYWNETLNLLWTPNLEHSRLTRMWSAYDSLTNSFAVEATRYMLLAAKRQEPGNAELLSRWQGYRDAMIAGLDSSLTYTGEETLDKPIYAEMLGHVNGYGPLVRDPTVLIFGMSWVQTAITNCFVANLSNAGGNGPLAPLAGLGLSVEKLDSTFDTYAQSGSFLWLGEDPERSALVQTTNVNSSQLRAPPFAGGRGPAPPPSCDRPLVGKDALTLASGADSWKSSPLTQEECCVRCEAVGPSACRSWFWRGDTQACFLKLDVTQDDVTEPQPFFAAGRSTYTPRWCDTPVSWPFGMSCQPGCPCPARVVIGKGLGWETGWAAHRERWTRLIALTRWLGAAHHVEEQPLFGENMDYDCIKAFELGHTQAPSQGRCWGDPGNGVQIGWWVWGQALLRRKLNILDVAGGESQILA